MARSLKLLASAALVCATLWPAAAPAAPARSATPASADCAAAMKKAEARTRVPAACHAINTKGTGMAGRAAQVSADTAASCPAAHDEKRGVVTGVSHGTSSVTATSSTGTVGGMAAGGPVVVTVADRGVVTAAGQMVGSTDAAEPAAHAKDPPPRPTGISQGGPVTISGNYRATGATGTPAEAGEAGNSALPRPFHDCPKSVVGNVR